MLVRALDIVLQTSSLQDFHLKMELALAPLKTHVVRKPKMAVMKLRNRLGYLDYLDGLSGFACVGELAACSAARLWGRRSAQEWEGQHVAILQRRKSRLESQSAVIFLSWKSRPSQDGSRNPFNSAVFKALECTQSN